MFEQRRVDGPDPAGGRIRVGIVGLGRSGWNIHAAGLADRADYAVVAVADPVPERLDEARDRFGCAAHAEPEGVFADESVDLVVIAAPSHTHVPLAIAALDASKHVVVEKPMAETVSGVDRITVAAKEADRLVTCFHNNRFDPTFLAIQDVVASGKLGELVLIRRSHHGFWRRSDWQTLRKFGGGQLANAGSHFLDQLLLLMDGDPVELFVDLRRTLAAGDAEDHVKLCMKGPTGPMADLESSSSVAWAQPAWFIAGTAGGLVSTESGIDMRWCDPDQLGAWPADEGPAEDRGYRGLGEIDWHTESRATERPSGQRTDLFYDNLAAALRGDAELCVTLPSIRRQIDVIERARLLSPV
ncbi:Gfo/Idh/MocA family protein [Phytoactinopolyspora limicola]|uniref:Gfo/Idh/MocA family protein n=1 Tax=Phytoactinopolyspora limicola TaxID=2715536 RepID=UPI00140CA4FE|nr:Gfo/Idh/MocA family oxidoreductase [Phytoactinopolyspora limicola]